MEAVAQPRSGLTLGGNGTYDLEQAIISRSGPFTEMLASTERYCIAAQLMSGFSSGVITGSLGRDPSTVGRRYPYRLPNPLPTQSPLDPPRNLIPAVSRDRNVASRSWSAATGLRASHPVLARRGSLRGT